MINYRALKIRESKHLDNGKAETDDVQEEELEFDDPRFLLSLQAQTSQSSGGTSSSTELSYAEKRRKVVGKGRERARLTQMGGSLKEREVEMREWGMRTNLIELERAKTEQGRTQSENVDQDVDNVAIGVESIRGERKQASSNQKQSIAFKLMKGMGFEPGQALGKKRSATEATIENDQRIEESSSSSLGIGHRGGLGMKSAFTNDNSTASDDLTTPRLEPIGIHIREKRAGLGIPQPKAKFNPSFFLGGRSSQPQTTSSKLLENVDEYLAHIRSSIDSKKIQGYLITIRRTLETLDRKNGIEDNPMWRDPDELEANDLRDRRKRLNWVGDDRFEEVERDLGENRKKRSEARGQLAYAKGLSTTVVDLDEEDADSNSNPTPTEPKFDKVEEEQAWYSLDAPTRLAYSLKYLRREYSYCFWCGCQYDDPHDLEQNCPGENEVDH